MGWLRLVVLAGGLAVGYSFESMPVVTAPADLRTASGVLAGVDATLLGFLVSAGALLYAVANTKLIQNLQKTKHFEGLLRDLFVDALAFLVALVFSTLSAFMVHNDAVPSMVVQAMVALNFVALVFLVPLGYNFWLVLSGLKPENPGAIGTS